MNNRFTLLSLSSETLMTKSLYRDEATVLLRLLKQCRTEAGLTQAGFAQALDRPQSFVSDIERGLRRLDLIQLRDICGIFGITLSEFVARFEEALKEA